MQRSAAGCLLLALWTVFFGCAPGAERAVAGAPAKPGGEKNMEEKVLKTDEEWRKELTPEQYRVLRQGGTEMAFTGKLWNNHEKGMYRCAACGEPLFSSDAKFDSGTGWPSFSQPVDAKNVATEEDASLGVARVEVLCARCGGHLGHVFEDGPRPTGMRYCINSAALEFAPKEK